MSVNSSMKAIADKIRAIIGISGTMSLSSMASNLNTVQTNISSAFTAIGNKGGTVPNSKTSGNLASAINSIPKKVPVQRKTGAFSPSGAYGAFTLNIGFKPDYVIFTQGKSVTSYGVTYPYEATATFETSDVFDAVLWETAENQAANGILYDITGERNGNTLSGNVYAAKFDLSLVPFIGGTFQYIAVKYSE